MLRNLSWLPSLCQRAQSSLGALLDVPQTIIHGEYYPMNLLISDGKVYPVDWESAARAPGELDFATLTDRCDAGMVERCELAYRQARWPEGAPTDFTRSLDLARLYMHFRWLGDTPGTKLRRRSWRYDQLRAVSQRLGLL